MDWREIGSIGGFFALRTEGVAGVRLAEVYEGDRGPLRRRVETVAARLRAPEPRIAVSVAHLGLAARLWSVTLGCAALHGRVPDLARLHWDPAATSPDDLWLDRPDLLPTNANANANAGAGAGADAGADVNAPADAARIVEVVIDGHLEPLAACLRREYRVQDGLLWGNAGSALAGAARELDAWARSTGRADVAGRAAALTDILFTHPRLRLTGTLRDTGHGPAFRRRSCCLYYRCPGGGLCGDCCFEHPPRAAFRTGRI